MYLGPETIVPLASILAAVGGVLLMFWRRTVAFVRSGLRSLRRGISRLLGDSSTV